jgi:REP element-mobilizing transposase RayT
MSEHIRKEHNVNLLLYHLVCPVKYRRKVLTPSVTHTLKSTCREIEERYELRYAEVGADLDHVHFLIQSVPMMLPKKIVQLTKSIIAREIFKNNPEVKKMLWGGSFWTSGYYINTVGRHGSEKVIANYVKNQGQEYQRIDQQQLGLF